MVLLGLVCVLGCWTVGLRIRVVCLGLILWVGLLVDDLSCFVDLINGGLGIVLLLCLLDCLLSGVCVWWLVVSFVLLVCLLICLGFGRYYWWMISASRLGGCFVGYRCSVC